MDDTIYRKKDVNCDLSLRGNVFHIWIRCIGGTYIKISAKARRELFDLIPWDNVGESDQVNFVDNLDLQGQGGA